MCGIMAYVGARDALPIVLDGLRRLEYRGYDSAGVAVLADGAGGRPGAPAAVVVRRAPGKLNRLAERLAAEGAAGQLHGRVALGHTRWATHGAPTERNAHPQADCRGETAVIHNGIVENHEALRDQLQAEGHCFASETDTEVIAHLIERYLAGGAAFPLAVRLTLRQLRGANAVTVANGRWPSQLVAGRVGHAGGLVIARDDDGMLVASDLPAILDQARAVAFLEDGEIATVTATGAAICRLDGRPVERPYEAVPGDPAAAAKGGYPHFMLKEIHEQPRALGDTIRGRLLDQAPWVKLDQVRLAPEAVRALKRVVFIACGTAWHSGLVGKFLVEELAGLPVEVDYASEFRYRRPLLDAQTLVVAISQSGETADTLVSMEAARRAGAPVLGVVNVVGSQAARLAAGSVGVLTTRAGPEIGVASTKAFTAQLAALALLALYLAGARGTLPEAEAAAFARALAAVPEQAAAVLGASPRDAARVYEPLAAQYHRATDALYLGRGVQYPIALEGALKLKEISYIHAEGYPAGELKHGPIALIDEAMPVVALVPHDRAFDKMLSNVREARARGARVIAVTSSGDEPRRRVAATADHVVTVPETEPLLAPIVATVPLQLLAYYIGVRRGCDVDQPRNLAKSVTVE